VAVEFRRVGRGLAKSLTISPSENQFNEGAVAGDALSLSNCAKNVERKQGGGGPVGTAG
jgi:hypothetical protein